MNLLRNLIFGCFLFQSQYALGSVVYLKAQLGMSVTTDGTLDGSDVNTQIAAPYPITLGLGVNVGGMSSFALEINYETMDIEDLPPSVTAIGSDTQTQVSAMLNYYFHTPKIFVLEPFIGLGVGYTELTIEKNEFKGDSFSWQISAGTDIRYSDFLYLVGELRVFNPTEFALTDSNDVDVGDFNTTQVKLLVGLKLKF